LAGSLARGADGRQQRSTGYPGLPIGFAYARDRRSHIEIARLCLNNEAVELRRSKTAPPVG
jgi:hypothetical protein